MSESHPCALRTPIIPSLLVRIFQSLPIINAFPGALTWEPPLFPVPLLFRAYHPCVQ